MCATRAKRTSFGRQQKPSMGLQGRTTNEARQAAFWVEGARATPSSAYKPRKARVCIPTNTTSNAATAKRKGVVWPEWVFGRPGQRREKDAIGPKRRRFDFKQPFSSFCACGVGLHGVASCANDFMAQKPPCFLPGAYFWPNPVVFESANCSSFLKLSLLGATMNRKAIKVEEEKRRQRRVLTGMARFLLNCISYSLVIMCKCK